MKLTKIKIENFKSIKDLEFDVKRYGSSYTSMFVGINEVGKSNLLEAMSFFDTPKYKVNFKDFNNRNNISSKYIDLYFYMEFEDNRGYLDGLKEKLELSKKFIDNFRVKSILKNIFLEKGKEKFQEQYEFEFEGIISGDFFSKATSPKTEIKHKSELFEEDDEQYVKLDDEKINEILNPLLQEIAKTYEPGITFWKPEKEYLITESVDLNKFKDDTKINIPLKNIFALSGYKEDNKIKFKIEEIKDDFSLRRSLQSELTSNVTKYFGGQWNHKIEIDIEISEGLKCTVNIKDKGKSNENKFFNMNSRSQGFHQFMSLILSLSIQSDYLDMKNKLILIDEPENHLHPSGIRDMRNTLLKIGEKNYVFLATHSCFMIDKANKERNFIMTKDAKQNTLYSQIREEEDIFDDEVLTHAFGINVYKDFLTPNKLLVEGLSDKKILLKAIKKLNIKIPIGISNGYGSNIVAVASRFELEDIKSIVLLDDDDSGRSAKEKILKIGDIYSDSNVLTIRDIDPSIITNGTIEDLLGLEFIQSQLNSYWEDEFQKEKNNLTLIDTKPFLEQIKIHLRKNKSNENVDKFLEGFKTKISEEFNPTNMETNFPKLKILIEKIESKFQRGD